MRDKNTLILLYTFAFACLSFAPNYGIEGSGRETPRARSRLTSTPDVDKLALFRKRLKDYYGTEDLEIEHYQAKTEKGDTASGVEVDKTEEEITIDTTPCNKKKSLITFHVVYKKEPVSDITCEDKKNHKRIQVIQQ